MLQNAAGATASRVKEQGGPRPHIGKSPTEAEAGNSEISFGFTEGDLVLYCQQIAAT